MGYAGKIEIEEQNHLIGSALYGICETPGATAAKIVTLPDFDTLIDGITIKVKFLYSNTAANPTLNVNGTGALPIYRHGVTTPGTSAYDTWAANAVLSFTYDGTAWRMEEPFDLTQIRQTMLNAVYPVGSIYMSVNSTSPSSLFGGTWVQLKDRFLLGAGDTYSAGATGGAATVTLTTAQMPAHAHSVGAHSHGLNSHTHSVGAHSHGLNSHTHSVGAHAHGLNNHTHSIPALNGLTSPDGSHQHEIGLRYVWYDHPHATSVHTSYWSDQYNPDLLWSGWSGTHYHTIATNPSTTGGNTGSTANSSAFNSGGPSTASTANSAAFNSGGPSTANTANSSAFNTGNNGSGSAHNNMPPYLVVYMWKRTG